jgi:hypothetical protein
LISRLTGATGPARPTCLGTNNQLARSQSFFSIGSSRILRYYAVAIQGVAYPEADRMLDPNLVSILVARKRKLMEAELVEVDTLANWIGWKLR